MRVTRKTLKELVDVAGIEPATPCLQRLTARRINKLWTECYQLSLTVLTRYRLNRIRQLRREPERCMNKG
jgi:hypothetical protein